MNRVPRSALFLSLAAAVVLAPSLSLGCSSTNPAAPDASLAASLKRQADAWDQAIIRKDLKAIAANMSADFRHIGKTGEIADRAAFLKDIVSPDLVINPYSVEDFDIRIYGDCALLCGRTRMTGSYQGKPFGSHYRYIDTYVRVGGEWKVCNVQITGMAD